MKQLFLISIFLISTSAMSQDFCSGGMKFYWGMKYEDAFKEARGAFQGYHKESVMGYDDRIVFMHKIALVNDGLITEALPIVWTVLDTF